MIAWSLVAGLYIVGCIGLHAVARDVNRGPIRDRRAWINLFFWPVMIPAAKLADIFDHLNG